MTYVMPDNGKTSWASLLPTMQTGDLLLFSGTSWQSWIIQQGTSGPFSHSAMIWRQGDGTPCLWEECEEQAGLDPITATLHSGAQLGDAVMVTREIVAAGDTPYYRRLIWNRPATFDSQVWDIMRGLDGIPFPAYAELVSDYTAGHVWNIDTTSHHHMFCSMLVAKTYQAAGLLGTEHPPNYYSPSSFSSVTNEVALQLGATFAPEIGIIV
jgi:hypothetical protein